MKIISRHPGAIAWLKSKGYDGEVISHFESSEIGETYIGTLPIPIILNILENKGKFILLSLPAIAFSERGQELSPKEMDDAGAELFEIYSIDMKLIK